MQMKCFIRAGHERFPSAKKMLNLQPPVANKCRNDGKIELGGENLLNQDRTVGFRNVKPYVRMLAYDALDRRSQGRSGHCRHQSNEYVAGNARERFYRVAARFDVPQDLDAAAVIGVSRRRRRDLTLRAGKELNAEAFFQLAYMLGNARLRSVLSDCCRRKRALFVRGDENANISQAFRHNASLRPSVWQPSQLSTCVRRGLIPKAAQDHCTQCSICAITGEIALSAPCQGQARET